MDVCRTGWLSPTGEFIPCETGDHIATAREILNNDSVVPDKELLNLGYVKITIQSFFTHGYSTYNKLNLTPEQLQFLKPYYYGEYGLQMCDESKKYFEYELEELLSDTVYPERCSRCENLSIEGEETWYCREYNKYCKDIVEECSYVE